MPQKVIFCVANPGTGKSFTGDYLAVVHDFAHIDGDFPLKKQYMPEYKDIGVDFVIHLDYANKGEDGPEKIWKPFYDLITNSTIEAAKTSENVVLTFACQRQVYREYVMAKLKAGIKSLLKEDQNVDNVVQMMYLTINEDVKLNGLYHRQMNLAIAGGMKLADMMRLGDGDVWDGPEDEEISMEDFKIFQKKHTWTIRFDDRPGSTTIRNGC